jgi:magnesium-protoporphyrin O-methyltransferase
MPEPQDCCANTFSDKSAEGDLRSFRERGPNPTTRALIEAIVERGVDGATVLDIGGGVGAVQFGLLEAGASRVEGVDASGPYVAAVRQEAVRRGVGDRLTARAGDFVELAPTISSADVVTLDRVLCCYSALSPLLGAAAARADRLLGLVYPRDVWWNRVAARVMNAITWLVRDPTRWYLYRTADVEDLLRAAGFTGRLVRRDLVWQVLVYERAPRTAVTAGG